VDGQEKEYLKALDLPIHFFYLFRTIDASGGPGPFFKKVSGPPKNFFKKFFYN